MIGKARCRTPADRLREAVERHESALLRYTARIVGDADRARDVVQDAFLRLWESDRPPADGHVVEWLFTVCRNRAIDLRRKDRRMNPLTDGALASQPGGEATPAAAAERNETQGRLLDLLDALPDAQQEAVRLKFQNGFTYRQIAGITGKSVSNVGFLLHTAIAALRRKLDAPARDA